MKRAWLLPFLAALAAGGCGQKGPLYLPDKNAKVVTAPTSAAPEAAPPAQPEGTAPAQTEPPADAAQSAATPAAKPRDKDQDQSSPPKP
jgi:predicted small lipoprotein YifL